MIYVDENIDSDVEIHKILTDINDNENLNFDNIILAIASSFYTNVVLFDSTTDYIVITGRNVKCNAPIFIQKVEHIDRKFNSLQYKGEDLQHSSIPNFTKKHFLYDNLGKAHLKTPHSGPSHVFLCAQRFHSTTVATHVTDLLQILKPQIELHGTSSFMVLSDGGPDFTPNSVINSIFFFCLFKRNST